MSESNLRRMRIQAHVPRSDVLEHMAAEMNVQVSDLLLFDEPQGTGAEDAKRTA